MINKNKLHISLSMPQLAKPVDTQEIEDTLEDIQHHLSKATQTEYDTHTTNFKIMHIKLTTVAYYFAMNVVTNEVVYFVRIRTAITLPNLPRPACRQVLVWRANSAKSGYGFLTGLARKIFWNHVFGANKCAISDSLQTEDGARFWRNLVQTAFSQGLKVRVLDTQRQTFKDYFNEAEFIEDDGKIWGHEEWFIHKIIAIYS